MGKHNGLMESGFTRNVPAVRAYVEPPKEKLEEKQEELWSGDKDEDQGEAAG